MNADDLRGKIVRGKFGQCGWHYGEPVDNLRLVLVADMRYWMCPDCRKHLKGNFSYVKKWERT